MTSKSEELITQLEVEIVKRDARIAELEAPMLAWAELDYTKQTRRSLMCYIGQQNFRITSLEKQIGELERDLSLAHMACELAEEDLAALNKYKRFESLHAESERELAALKAQRPVSQKGLAAQVLKAQDAIKQWPPELRIGLRMPDPKEWLASGEPSAGVVLPDKYDDDTSYGQGRDDAIDEVARLNTCRAQAVPDVLFDGFAVYSALNAKAQRRTSPENVSDTLDAAVRLIRAAAPPASAAAVPVPKLLGWAVDRWHAEVSQRPLVNAHRRILDDTWRQVIRKLGGDPVGLCGPAHDTLLSTTNHGEPQ